MYAIVKNEHKNLIEQTTYHYYMLNIRYLVFCNDLGSHTSPLQALKNWSDLIKIEVWEVDDFSPLREANGKTLYNLYVPRQMDYITKCMKHFKEQHRTWAAFIDPDEYMVFSTVTDNDNKCIYDKSSIMTINNQPTYKIQHNAKNWPKKCKSTVPFYKAIRE